VQVTRTGRCCAHDGLIRMRSHPAQWQAHLQRFVVVSQVRPVRQMKYSLSQ
jgi:hypothetical protein